MTITDADLKAGAQLVGVYRKARFTLDVTREPGAGVLAFVLKGGGRTPIRVGSVSAGASIVLGHKANGRRFWSPKPKPSAFRTAASRKAPIPDGDRGFVPADPAPIIRKGQGIEMPASTILVAEYRGHTFRGLVRGEGPDARLVVLEAGDSDVEVGAEFASLSGASGALTGKWLGQGWWAVDGYDRSMKPERNAAADARAQAAIERKGERLAAEAARARRADVAAKAKRTRELTRAAKARKAVA